MSRPGRDFAALLAYQFRPDKQPELLGGSMAGEDPESLAREFGDWRVLNKRVSKPVFHASLSAAPGERLSAERWLDVAEAYIVGLGYAGSPWVAIRHHDGAMDHVHLVAARIDSERRYVRNYQEWSRGAEICRQIEHDYGLRETPRRSGALRAAPFRVELATFERSGRVSVRARLQEHLELAGRDCPTMSRFVERLETQGIAVRARLDPAGRVLGVSFAWEGFAFRGASLGHAYSWRGLQERQGIDFDPERDLSILRGASARAATATGSTRATRLAARDLGLPAMPALARPVEAFRQAAVVESRTEILARQEQLEDARRAAAATSRRLRLEAAEGDHLRQAAARARRDLGAAVEQIYRDAAPAARRLGEALAAGRGEAVAAALERDPGAYGALRGHGAGALASGARRQALAAVPAAARTLREASAAERRASAYQAEAAARAEQLRDAERRVAASEAMRRRLPDRETVRRDLLLAAQRLGADAVRALSRQAARQVESVLRFGWSSLRRLAPGLESAPQRGLDRSDSESLGR